jgi:hypothetical protein
MRSKTSELDGCFANSHRGHSPPTPSASVPDRQWATNHSREHERELASLLHKFIPHCFQLTLQATGAVPESGAASVWVHISQCMGSV